MSLVLSIIECDVLDSAISIYSNDVSVDSDIEYIHVICPSDGNIADAFNYGLSKSSGDYVLFLKTGSAVMLDELDAFLLILKKKSYDIITFNIRELYNEGNRRCIKSNNYGLNCSALIKQMLMGMYPIEVSNKIIRKSILEKMNIIFDVKLKSYLWLDFCAKLFSHNPSIIYIDRFFVESKADKMLSIEKYTRYTLGRLEELEMFSKSLSSYVVDSKDLLDYIFKEKMSFLDAKVLRLRNFNDYLPLSMDFLKNKNLDKKQLHRIYVSTFLKKIFAFYR